MPIIQKTRSHRPRVSLIISVWLSPTLTFDKVCHNRDFNFLALIGLDTAINLVEPDQDTDAERRSDGSNDPEYERLMKIVRDDFAAQLERVREMERNGEIPPPPQAEDIL